MKKYVVIGSTGNTGKPISKILLAAGHEVRILSRSAEKARDLVSIGAKLYEGSPLDADLLDAAMEGADAAYLMIPFDPTTSDHFGLQVRHAEAAARAFSKSGVKHIVSLSSIGAHLDQGSGVVQGLNRMEGLLNQLSQTHCLHLRAGYFLENGFMMAGMARQMGIIGSPVKANIPIPMVATSDIADMVAKRLLALDFSGTGIQYVLGARDYTYSEIAKIYGQAIGNPDLSYVEFPFDQAAGAMISMGLSENITERMMEFIKGLNDGKILEEVVRGPENTTETTAETFSQKFKQVYDSMN